MKKPKRYYVAMKIRKTIEITGYAGSKAEIDITCPDQGVVGFLPVFTNKAKAKKFGEIFAVQEISPK
jgi:hypothetical protein